jgi:NAD-dependent SIR2 family protein deacetylase
MLSEKLKNSLDAADAVIIGAGAGLSTSAGFTYSGERFSRYFSDFIEKYKLHDMYSGGFYNFETIGEYWAYWSRYIYINRYMDPPKPLYHMLFNLVKDKDYFVLTTNVDHCFQKSGFDKDRLFYTQGDYGLFQCSKPCHENTYDNLGIISDMVKSQGFTIADDGTLMPPEVGSLKISVHESLIPKCPVCGRSMSMNLRADSTFVQDSGWYRAAERYNRFLNEHKNDNILFLELGIGYNTPSIVKYPFWQMTNNWKNSVYVCINKGEAIAPDEIKDRSICINDDILSVIERLL